MWGDRQSLKLCTGFGTDRAGHGQVVAVIGEPGVGKTRLFHEFTHASHSQGWLLLESSSTSYGKATPYLPVIDLLKAYSQIEDRDDTRRVRDTDLGTSTK